MGRYPQSVAEEICEVGRRLYERGLIAATEGNISRRTPDAHVLCTPTHISKGYMDPADLCVVDMDGRQVSGGHQPSSEIQLHLRLYRTNPLADAVVHCHPPHATAFAVSQAALPVGLLAEAEYFLGEVPLIEYRTPGSAELAAMVEPYAKSSRCAILRNHGAISWDRTLQQAMWWIEMLDACCRIAILARGLGTWSLLAAENVAELRQRGRRCPAAEPAE